MDRIKKIVRGLGHSGAASSPPPTEAAGDTASPEKGLSPEPEDRRNTGHDPPNGCSTTGAKSAAAAKSSSRVETSPGEAPASPPVAAAQERSAAKSSGKTKSSKKDTAKPKEKATRRLMREYQDMVTKGEFICNLVEDNLFEWDVELTELDSDSTLHKDMLSAGVDAISLHFSFPQNYPFAPPFVRVQEPYITGGYVMDGGAICMELLTAEGWSGAYTAEAIVRQFAASLVAGKARLTSKARVAYTQDNAKQSFKRVVKVHEARGWYTPPKGKG